MSVNDIAIIGVLLAAMSLIFIVYLTQEVKQLKNKESDNRLDVLKLNQRFKDMQKDYNENFLNISKILNNYSDNFEAFEAFVAHFNLKLWKISNDGKEYWEVKPKNKV